MKRRVTFSVTHTTDDGKQHKPDSTASLDALEARRVVHLGRGRYADATTEAGTADNQKEQADG